MMMPILASWGSSMGVSSSALLMPLSFATMLGGTLSMIGSSTNLVAANAANKHDPNFSMKVAHPPASQPSPSPSTLSSVPTVPTRRRPLPAAKARG